MAQKTIIFLKYFFILIIIFISPRITAAEYNLPSARRITWNPGIDGGIPSRTTIFRTLSPVAGDDTSQIESAINSCTAGQVVYLNAGTYQIGSTLNLNKGITLRGAGQDSTILELTGTRSNGISINSGGYKADNYQGILSQNTSKGDTVIFIGPGEASNFSVNDYVIIDQENDSTDATVTNVGVGTCTWCGNSRCSGDYTNSSGWNNDPECSNEGDGISEGGKRTVGQIAKITAINTGTDTITFDQPVNWNYLKSAYAMVLKISNVLEGAGIEDLTINGSTADDINNSVFISYSSACWLKNVEIDTSDEKAVKTEYTYRCEYRQNYVHHAVSYGSNHGYGIVLNQYATSALVEDNIFQHLHDPIMFEGSGTGNVIAYNYMHEPTYSDPLRLASDIVFHGAHPHFNLIESNICYEPGPDFYWGSSSHNTLFRNRIYGYKSGLSYDQRAIKLDKNEQYYNVVGNILGVDGVPTTYELEGSTDSGCYSKVYIYKLGYVSSGDYDSSNNDAEVKNTLLKILF